MIPQFCTSSSDATAQNLVPIATAQNSDIWCTVIIVKTLTTAKNENSKLTSLMTTVQPNFNSSKSYNKVLYSETSMAQILMATVQ